jgi:serine/threonine-protein kinase
MVLAYVPEGEFWMGTSEDEPVSNYEYMDERPLHSVYLNAFWIDQTEVTNAMFQGFVEATGYQTDAEMRGWSWVGYYKRNSDRYKKEDGAFWNTPLGAESNIKGLEDHPVVNVSWNDAAAYCKWAGRRLPTEAEWEKAARGTDGMRYPWGDQPLAGEYLNFADVNVNDEPDQDGIDDGFRYTAPVGSYPAGASPYGAMDMAGNVWEWVADWYGFDYYVTTPYNNPEGPSSGKYRVLRGGCWIDKAERTRAANRAWGNYAFEPDASANYVGFRCAMDGGP